MAVVVIGGHTRNIGKTSVVAGLIGAMREREWTAMKITQFGHGVCSTDGKACECATADHTVAVSEERSAQSGTDTARYLAAGARRSLWIRTRQGQLFEAMPRIRREIAESPNVVMESNSVLQFLKPDVFVSVLDPGVTDFKGSARRYLDRADAVLLVRSGGDVAPWMKELRCLLGRVPTIDVSAREYVPQRLISLVTERLAAVALV